MNLLAARNAHGCRHTRLQAPRWSLAFVATIVLSHLVSWPATAEGASGSLCIREFVAANATGLQDEDGDTPDWIEVENRGADVISLASWSLSDDLGDPQRWTFPDRALAPGGRLVVFASQKDRAPATGVLHTNFALSSSGESIVLAENGISVDSIMDYPEQRADISYGRRTSDDEWRYLDPPTPAQPNDGVVEYLGITPTPMPSVLRGWFVTPEPFLLELGTGSAAASIRYTWDGSSPSESTGLLYGGPLEVVPPLDRPGIVLRAIAYQPDSLPSRVATHTYFFVDGWFAQADAPAGFPDQWGSHPAADYGVDPEISGDPAYTSRWIEALSDIPTVSIVLDSEEFFGPGGIYSNPTSGGSNWERTASVEIVPTDGRPPIQADCGLRVYGGASRNPSNTPKHSLRIIFRSLYGESELSYPLFPESSSLRLNSIVLRGGYNHTWLHGSGSQRSRSQYLRDEFMRQTQLAMGRVASHGSHVHLFINGLYWGLYNPTERPDAEFAAHYLGGHGFDYDALNAGSLIDGTNSAWQDATQLASSGLADPAAYAAFANRVDLESFIDYMILNFWGGNTDWPGHNWYAAGRRTAGGKFHFFSWDAEHTFKSVGQDVTGTDGGSPGQFYAALRENAEFRLLFADRAAHWLRTGGPLSPDVATDRYLELASRIDRAIIGESARWGDFRRDAVVGSAPLYERDLHWVSERDNIVDNYLPTRASLLREQLRNRDLFPDVDPPSTDLPSGAVDPAALLSLDASAPSPATPTTIYFTLDGSDPRDPTTGEPSSTSMTYDDPIILPASAELRARARSGAEWSALTQARYWHREPGLTLRVTELNYHPAPSTHSAFPDEDEYEYLRITNVGNSTVNLTGCRFVDGIQFEFATGPITFLAPGESIYVARNLSAFALRYGSDLTVTGPYSGRLSNGGETVGWESNSGETIQTFTYSDDWYPATDGWGYSLWVQNPDAQKVDWNQAAQWRTSASAYSESSPATSAGSRISGDWNSDGQLDVTDLATALAFLFTPDSVESPCETWPGTVGTMDLNGDLAVNVSDVLFGLAYLFQAGPAPIGGLECEEHAGCDSACP